MAFLGARPIDEQDRSTQIAQITLALATLGLALRQVRFLQIYPMWCDETMVAVNLLDRPWTALAEPLDYRQICPLAFVVLEWASVRMLGFSEAALRLVPLLSALASVPLFYRLAARVLGRGSIGALVAVGIFAVAQPPIRFAAEVKPYASDLLVATVLLTIAGRWRSDPARPGGLWLLAALAPLALASSLPAVFVLGAIAIVALLDIPNRGSPVIVAWVGFLAAIGVSVGALAVLGQYHTGPDDRAYFLRFWANAFPPSIRTPSALAGWIVRIHTGALFAYPHGENRSLAWLNVVVLAGFLLGVVALARKHRSMTAILVLPFALTLSAAALRRYPYGWSPRVAQFLLPSTLILVGAGAEWVVSRLGAASIRRLVVPGLTVFLVALGLWRTSTDFTRPFRTPWDRTAREFARWFWEELGADSELVCVRSDLGIPFRPGRWQYDGTDQYLCYQRIFSRRHHEGRPPRWDAISAAHPLRCVLLNRMPHEVPGFLAWLEANKDRFALRDVRTYRATRGSPVEPGLTYVVCELLPVAPAPIALQGLDATRR